MKKRLGQPKQTGMGNFILPRVLSFNISQNHRTTGRYCLVLRRLCRCALGGNTCQEGSCEYCQNTATQPARYPKRSHNICDQHRQSQRQKPSPQTIRARQILSQQPHLIRPKRRGELTIFREDIARPTAVFPLIQARRSLWGNRCLCQLVTCNAGTIIHLHQFPGARELLDQLPSAAS